MLETWRVEKLEKGKRAAVSSKRTWWWCLKPLDEESLQMFLFKLLIPLSSSLSSSPLPLPPTLPLFAPTAAHTSRFSCSTLFDVRLVSR